MFLKSWRRRRALERTRIDTATWDSVVAGLHFLKDFPPADMDRLRELAVLFLNEKEMTGAGGFTLTDEVCLSIAAQACLPVLNLGLDPWYEGWVGIIVYPSEFRVRREEVDEDGVLHEWDDEISGEAWPGGPVVLSWEDIGMADGGYNVVIHEFAHKIDMRSSGGDAEGYPQPHRDMDGKTWEDTLESAYARFCGMVDRGRETLLDPYAAEHPAEFFAVATEAFFTDPHGLIAEFPRLYEQLRLFYRQHPAARLAPLPPREDRSDQPDA
jgi:Mlc titration factor MtfA (ptsG expression regulator)